MKMKDSGIEWIGEIPEMWEKVKFNAIYNNRNTKVSDRDYEPLSVTKKGIVPQLGTAAKTNDNDNRKLVRSGDFVINSRSDRRGSCGISSLDGSVSLINTVLEPRNSQIEPLYFDFLFHTVQFADEFYKWGHGIVDDLWTTNWNDMKNITLIFPPKVEQQQIANFLDLKTAEINGLIDKINAEIESLKQYQSSVITQAVTKGLDPNVPMKDSGIEWIGEIPETWETPKLKYLLSEPMKYGANESGISYSESLPRYIRITDITLDGKLKNTAKLSLSEKQAQDYILKDKSILFARSGATVGKTFLYRSSMGRSAFAGYLISANIDESKVDTKWIYYFTKSDSYLGWVNNVFSQSTIQNISADKYENMPLSVTTDIAEQHRIINYLDKKTNTVKKIIKSKQQQVEQLSEYKNSLIFEYVTGKKQVPQLEGRN